MAIRIVVTKAEVEDAVLEWVKKNHGEEMKELDIHTDYDVACVDGKIVPAMMVGIEKGLDEEED